MTGSVGVASGCARGESADTSERGECTIIQHAHTSKQPCADAELSTGACCGSELCVRITPRREQWCEAQTRSKAGQATKASRLRRLARTLSRLCGAGRG